MYVVTKVARFWCGVVMVESAVIKRMVNAVAAAAIQFQRRRKARRLMEQERGPSWTCYYNYVLDEGCHPTPAHLQSGSSPPERGGDDCLLVTIATIIIRAHHHYIISKTW